MAHETNGRDLLSLWQRSMEQGLEAWGALATHPYGPLGPFGLGPQSPRPAGQAEAGPPDALTQWKKMLEDGVEAWSALMERVMAREEFAAAMGRSLDLYLNAMGPLRKSLQYGSEEFSRAMNLPTRKQVTSLAAQVVGMDARMEVVEDCMEEQRESLAALRKEQRPADRGGETADAESRRRLAAQIAAMDARLEGFENRIAELLQRIAALQAARPGDRFGAEATDAPGPGAADTAADRSIADAARQASQA